LLKNSSPPSCTLLAERLCLRCHSSKENDAIKVKLRSPDHSSTSSKHACAEGSVANLKRCYDESAHNFLLTYVDGRTVTDISSRVSRLINDLLWTCARLSTDPNI
jgi:hypothetical protein